MMFYVVDKTTFTSIVFRTSLYQIQLIFLVKMAILGMEFRFRFTVSAEPIWFRFQPNPKSRFRSFTMHLRWHMTLH